MSSTRPSQFRSSLLLPQWGKHSAPQLGGGSGLAGPSARDELLLREAANPRARTIRLTNPAIVHMKEWATFTANIAAGVKDAARTTISAKAPAIAPNTTRSAQREDLHAIEPVMKITNTKKRMFMRSSRCRAPLVMEAHDHTLSIRQKSETKASVALWLRRP